MFAVTIVSCHRIFSICVTFSQPIRAQQLEVRLDILLTKVHNSRNKLRGRSNCFETMSQKSCQIAVAWRELRYIDCHTISTHSKEWIIKVFAANTLFIDPFTQV